jgi:AcrR family transcriptional regulator
VIGAKGSEAVTIQEITAAADVGFGSFYNHFDSKQAILEAVIEEALERQGQLLDGLSAGIADPAERVALALKANLAATVADPEWGWLMVRLRESNPDPFIERLGRRGLRDIEAGVEAGRFRVDEPVSASVVIGAALFGVVRAVLDGRLQESAGVALAEYALRILGLSHEDAAAISLRTGAPLVAMRPLGRA